MRLIGWKTAIVVSGLALALTGCQDILESVDNRAEYKLPTKLVNKMKAHDQRVRAPVMMRIFKQEGILEVWKAKGTGRYALVKEYEICKWSGQLGPKFKEGDRQAPEGYYDIKPHQMNPNSSYYLSFNMGYPNRFDRAHNRTGSNLMVHGACSSAGCYSMTDEQVIEIYAFAREAFRGGQTAFQVQAYPFRMTADNMAAHRDSNHYEYWQMLKVGYDHFELTKKPPKIDVCEGRYVFNQVAEEEDGEFHPRRACPPSAAPQSLQLAYSAHKRKYDAEFEKAVKELEKPLKTPAIATLIAPKKPDQQSNIEQKAVSARQPLPSTAPEPTAPASVAPAPLPPADTTASIAIPTPSPAEPSGAGAKQPRKKKSWWRVW